MSELQFPAPLKPNLVLWLALAIKMLVKMMSVTSEQNLWVIMYFSHCSFPSTIIEAVLESSSSSLGHRRMSQNQMWSSLPFEGTVYPLIFNVVIYMISFSCSVLVCFSVSPLPFDHLFPFPVFIWLCCGSSWFSNILTKTVDGFALAGSKLEQTKTLNSLAYERQ